MHLQRSFELRTQVFKQTVGTTKKGYLPFRRVVSTVACVWRGSGRLALWAKAQSKQAQTGELNMIS